MNIPENIERGHMLQVLNQIREGILQVPPHQRSTKYCLVHDGIHHPPKYVVRMANVLANGDELWSHFGGEETNRFCESRGFAWVRCGGAPHPA